ncbi:MAG: FecR domain-containing protein [Desulfobacula sp.]|nr:FecR domain-containing protein [Desulfobacula sp.]
MKTIDEHIDLIIKFLSGETSADESKKLFDQMDKDDALKNEFKALKKTWDTSSLKPDKDISAINLDEEWNLFSKNINENSGKVISLKQNKKTFSITRIASVVAAVFVLGFAIFYFFDFKTTELVAVNSVIESHLPDGSQISLNTGSELEYAKNFNKNKRVVKLKGEAFFKVTHNPKKPFIVKAGKLKIEVVGTEFNVNAKSRKGNVEVVVNSGKVLVYTETDKSDAKLLKAGDKAKFILKKSKIIKETNTNPNFLAWKTKKLVFDRTKLEDIVRTLNHTYSVHIIIKNPALRNCTLTNTFEQQSLESILKVLEATLDIQISKKGAVYEISGKACEK